MTEICKRYRAILRTSDNKEQDALIHRARCKQWDCETCAKINARVWQARIGLEIERHGANVRWFFLTFTLDGYLHDSEGKVSKKIWRKQVSNSLKVWRVSWDKLMKRLKRQYGKFDYVRVFETHKDGTLHIHTLCNAKITDAVFTTRKDGTTYWHSATIESHLNDLALGYIHDAKPLGYEDKDFTENVKMIASYLAKYMTKDAQSDVRQALKIAGMGRIRIIQTSQKWSDLPKELSDRQWVTDAITFDDAMAIWKDGNKIIDINRKMIIDDGEHFSDTLKYPNRDSEIAYQLGQ